jgi:hypothetical protein
MVGRFVWLAGSIAVALSLPLASRGQTPLVPIGRPAMMAQGFSAVQNVPVYTPLPTGPFNSTQPTVPVFWPNQMSVRVENWVSMIHFPIHGTQPGSSPLPAPSSFPSTQYPNALNPFASPLTSTSKGMFGNGAGGI